MNVSQLTIELMKIPSVSGDEKALAGFLSDYLTALGWTVELQPAADDQFNVIACLNDSPRVWFSTHLDTVPPHIPPTEDDAKIYGRGSCDAKGIIAAQITAAERLRAQGIFDIGLLYTVEEERASIGARVANDHPLAAKCEYLINGEPTDNDLAIGSKGSMRLVLRTKGKAAHSAYPEIGDSAIDKLLDILEDIRRVTLPIDEFFGESTLNIGIISGGVGSNVVAPSAEAALHVRMVTPLEPVMEIIENAVDGRGEIEVQSCSLPVRMVKVEGFRQKVVRFTTDIPYLTKWGKPLLLGPGSILDAHTKDEFVLKKDLDEAVRLYEDLAKKLLGA
ncbi:MAG: M20/M25/M40 family metallo-hydrolase [Acidobacteria bacterium]|nr:M20/M25/M40 family metallo-hydrolase [Acidobacteriota bacterium]